MLLYAKYKDEAAFRQEFVKPLLNRLGFFSVAHTHGIREFGKDFVFSELNRFGTVRHNAAVVKHERSISQGTKVFETLLTQVRQAFTSSFTLTDSPQRRFISTVYVMNSGGITEGAKDDLVSTFAKEHYGENVHVYDSDRLEQISVWASYQDARDIRSKLQSLKRQLRFNMSYYTDLRHNMTQHSLRGIMLNAVEEFLTNPPVTDYVLITLLSKFWEDAKVIQAIIHKLIHLIPPIDDEWSDARVMMTDQIESICEIDKAIERHLQHLQPIGNAV